MPTPMPTTTSALTDDLFVLGAAGRAAEARLVSVFCAAFVAAGFQMALGIYSGKRTCS